MFRLNKCLMSVLIACSISALAMATVVPSPEINQTLEGYTNNTFLNSYAGWSAGGTERCLKASSFTAGVRPTTNVMAETYQTGWDMSSAYYDISSVGWQAGVGEQQFGARFYVRSSSGASSFEDIYLTEDTANLNGSALHLRAYWKDNAGAYVEFGGQTHTNGSNDDMFTPISLEVEKWYDTKVVIDFDQGTYGAVTGVFYRETTLTDDGAWTSIALNGGSIEFTQAFAPDYMGVRMRNVNLTGRVVADDLQVTIPEPATMMSLLGLSGIVSFIRRKK